MGKKKGFYLDFSAPPYPDEDEAKKNIADEEEIKQIKERFKPVDPRTGLSYAQVAAKNVATVVEKKEEIPPEEIEKFKQKNPWIIVHRGVIQEINPLDKNDITELPPIESLFNIK